MTPAAAGPRSTSRSVSATASARPVPPGSRCPPRPTTIRGPARARSGSPRRPAVDMDFTPEQELLRESVRRTCGRHSGTDVVRKLENDPVGFSPALWSALGELGLLGLTIDEEHGGSGMTMVEAAVVYEELGRALVPSPHFVSCVLAAGALARRG